MKTFVVVLACCASITAASVAAQVYKWVDKDGKLQYSDQPPPDAKVSTIKTPAPGPATGEATRDSGAGKKPQASAADAAKIKKEVADRTAEAAKAREKNQERCEAMRSQLRTVQDGGRIPYTNKDGERAFMDDDHIAKEIDKLTRAIAEECR